MTPSQNQLYWREWGQLSKRCKAEQWPEPDRHELHARALGYRRSHTLFNNKEFDKVLAVFRSYSQAENLHAQVRQERQPRKRLEYKIKIEQMKLLAVLVSQTLMPGCDPVYVDRPDLAGADGFFPDTEAAWNYVAEVMRGRFNTDDITQLSDQPDPTRRDEKSDLECLRDTLDARINQLRNKRGGADRGWSIHDLKTAAGVECGCAQCGKRRAVEKMNHAPLQTA